MTDRDPLFLTEADLQATLVFLSTAKSTYEFIGRQIGDGEERFTHSRMAIEELSLKFRTMLMESMRRRKEREIIVTIDKPAIPADITPKDTVPCDKRAVRRRRK